MSTAPEISPIELPLSPPSEIQESDLRGRVADVLHRGAEFLFSLQRVDGHWCAELESNPTITAEYVFLCRMLGTDLGERRPKITRYLLSRQNVDGSWSIARRWDGDVSSTAEVYLALRILGVDSDDPALRRAEHYILRNGGLEEVRIFTRIFFAMFGLMPWDAIPSIPPEFMLMPPQAPVNIYSLSSWARGTMVPLFVIGHHRPVFSLSKGNDWLDHLWINKADKRVPYSSPLLNLILKHRISWKTFFGTADAFLKVYEFTKIGPVRKRALKECTKWILERQEETGDWGGIFPPMMNGMIALSLEGHAIDSEPLKKGLRAIENFSWEDHQGYRIQACISPVWDTALAAIALLDSGLNPENPKIRESIQWLKERQLRVDHGDWKVSRPDLPSGGWSFEYSNSWYPDVDDTAVVLLALLKHDLASASGEESLRAVEWMTGMQNRDGGWAAFDVNNDKLFLNEIPFSDMDSLCDPSTPDVTGRVIEALGLFVTSPSEIPGDLRERARSACLSGLTYLRNTQEIQGSWFGRWGVNYIYGTSNVLCGLASAGLSAADPMVTSAIRWLKQVQNDDGGWGESLASYADKRWMGRGESTPSQTAWALMGLMGFVSLNDPVIEKGIRWLANHQYPARVIPAWHGGDRVPDARGSSWEETHFTGTGFPNHFYIRYHFYRHYFPMMALGRYFHSQEQ